ncbi:MAG TPA: hypothetical protein VJN18_34315 [Polyangiaceae bacterium]|nr:hypothetical protein [Polyangiaceae bacterium]
MAVLFPTDKALYVVEHAPPAPNDSDRVRFASGVKPEPAARLAALQAHDFAKNQVGSGLTPKQDTDALAGHLRKTLHDLGGDLFLQINFNGKGPKEGANISGLSLSGAIALAYYYHLARLSRRFGTWDAELVASFNLGPGGQVSAVESVRKKYRLVQQRVQWTGVPIDFFYASDDWDETENTGELIRPHRVSSADDLLVVLTKLTYGHVEQRNALVSQPPATAVTTRPSRSETAGEGVALSETKEGGNHRLWLYGGIAVTLSASLGAAVYLSRSTGTETQLSPPLPAKEGVVQSSREQQPAPAGAPAATSSAIPTASTSQSRTAAERDLAVKAGRGLTNVPSTKVVELPVPKPSSAMRPEPPVVEAPAKVVTPAPDANALAVETPTKAEEAAPPISATPPKPPAAPAKPSKNSTRTKKESDEMRARF